MKKTQNRKKVLEIDRNSSRREYRVETDFIFFMFFENTPHRDFYLRILVIQKVVSTR